MGTNHHEIDCKKVRIVACSSTCEQSKKRSGTRLKTESETGDSQARRAREVRQLRARKTRAPRFTDFFTDFEKKPTVLQSNHEKTFQSSLNRLKIGFVGSDKRMLPRSRKSMFSNIKSVLRVYDLANSRLFLVETNIFYSRTSKE